MSGFRGTFRKQNGGLFGAVLVRSVYLGKANHKERRRMQVERGLTRGEFLKVGGGALAGGYLAYAVGELDSVQAQSSNPWAQAARIRRQVNPPKFPNRDFLVTNYGAIGDGESDCTDAFRTAIAECTKAGGGRVVASEGIFLTGAIHLKDNVNLHVTDRATIRFSRDPESYLPVVYTRYEGVELYNYSPFIYAYDRQNIAITGSGIIDGRASEEYWWDWAGGESPNEFDSKERLSELVEGGTPVEERIFGEGHYLRPNMIQFYRCRNILLEGVTVKDSPMWNIHPVLSENILIQNITVDSPNGPNNDGCDPESCENVLIRGCTFSTGDDCIAFKAGKDADGRRVDAPCLNALVEQCEMADGNGGVTIGSETTGGVRNIFARNCRMSSPNLERALRIKTNPDRGGYIENINFENIRVGQVADSALEVALDYAGVDEGDYYPSVRNINVRNFRVQEGPRAFYLIGNEANPIQDLRLTNCRFEDMTGDNIIENVEGLMLRNVRINGRRFQRS